MTSTDRTEVQRAADARQVLDNAAFQHAMTTLRAQIVTQWKDCPIRDQEGQRLLLQLAKLTDKFEALLIGAIENGKLAQSRIDIDAERNEHPARKLMRRVL